MDLPSGDWAIISIDCVITRAKIVHRSGGKNLIVEVQKMVNMLIA